MDTLLQSISKTAYELQISRSEVYRLIKANRLKTVKIGRRRLISTSSSRGLAEEAA